MGGLLSELGKKLAERWLSLLVLPGALYLAVLGTAVLLGHGHPFDLNHLTHRISATAEARTLRTTGGQIVVLGAVLASSAGVGLAAQALGSLVERGCLAAAWRTWPRPLRALAQLRVDRRRDRWTTAAGRYDRLTAQARAARGRGERSDPAERWAAHLAMTRIAAERPDRPTWSGDRIHGVSARLDRVHQLDLATVWPYLWLTLPDTTRTEITAARQSLYRGNTLTAWALLYLPVAGWWWPAVLIGLALLLAGRSRTRAAADDYALLLEAAVRLHGGELAVRLGLTPASPTTASRLHTATLPGPAPSPDGVDGTAPTPLTPDLGDALTRALYIPPPAPPPDSL
ncbi:hypothetical protein H0H10_21875 [Streptomyces sp. TRM S81-3]|uniref:Vegetative cell wall protein gp1 n=1 Tax=Streptomyces griseicoloratus TaxID=2752516 RepID=A0A926L3D2_9ACTN|nr:hypothetical protein [Streptomyces griseicoloratus]MBD0421770.1 hypothetical protein [Streptomyces griseicoloratus]